MFMDELIEQEKRIYQRRTLARHIRGSIIDHREPGEDPDPQATANVSERQLGDKGGWPGSRPIGA